MAKSLEPSKRGSDRQSTIKYLPCGKNLVKIGLVGLEISMLKNLFFKRKNNASRTYSPRGMHAARAK